MNMKKNIEPDETSDAGLWNALHSPQNITFVQGHKWIEIKVKGNNKCPICSKALVPFQVKMFMDGYIYGFCTKCDRAFQYMPVNEE